MRSAESVAPALSAAHASAGSVALDRSSASFATSWTALPLKSIRSGETAPPDSTKVIASSIVQSMIVAAASGTISK